MANECEMNSRGCDIRATLPDGEASQIPLGDIGFSDDRRRAALRAARDNDRKGPMTLIAPVAELIGNVSTPFAQARAMPPSVYTSPAFLERELKDVFAREWFSVGRASALAKPGDYLTVELAGQPIIVIRDSQGTLRAMSNVCLHRMSTLLEGAGSRGASCAPITAGPTISTERCARRRRWPGTSASARPTTGCRRCAARNGSAG